MVYAPKQGVCPNQHCVLGKGLAGRGALRTVHRTPHTLHTIAHTEYSTHCSPCTFRAAHSYRGTNAPRKFPSYRQAKSGFCGPGRFGPPVDNSALLRDPYEAQHAKRIPVYPPFVFTRRPSMHLCGKMNQAGKRSAHGGTGGAELHLNPIPIPSLK